MGNREHVTYEPRVVATYGGTYVVSIDGTEDEMAPAVVYDPVRGAISHVAAAAQHLRFMHGYSEAFTGSDDERERVEAEVARLLAEGGDER